MDDFEIQAWLLVGTFIATLAGAVVGAFSAFQFELRKKRDDDRKATATAAVIAIYEWLQVLDSTPWEPVNWKGPIRPSGTASRAVSVHLRILGVQVKKGDRRAARIWESWNIVIHSLAERPVTGGVIDALLDFIADKDLEQIKSRLEKGDELNRQRPSQSS